MSEGHDWRNRGACVGAYSEMWLSDSKVDKRIAQHICLYHCPVLAKCRDDALDNEYVGVVAGGIIWTDTRGPSDKMPITSCAICFDGLNRERNARVHS